MLKFSIKPFSQFCYILFAASGLALYSSAAEAQLYTGTDAALLLDILDENEIEVEPTSSIQSSSPLILAKLASGAKFFVRLQSCDSLGQMCSIVQYGAIFTGATFPYKDYNEFNSKYALGKAYVDNEQQIYYEHALSLSGGVTKNFVEQNMFIFFNGAELFTKFMQEKLDAKAQALSSAEMDKDPLTDTAAESVDSSAVINLQLEKEIQMEMSNNIINNDTMFSTRSD